MSRRSPPRAADPGTTGGFSPVSPTVSGTPALVLEDDAAGPLADDPVGLLGRLGESIWSRQAEIL